MASVDASQPAKYRTLKSIFRERGQAAASAELARRLEGYSTYTADFMVGDHQLFYVATTDIVDASNASYNANVTLTLFCVCSPVRLPNYFCGIKSAISRSISSRVWRNSS